MLMDVDEGFQRKLDDFNRSQGGDQEVTVAFDARKNIWTVWVVPRGDTSHRDYDPEKLRGLMRNFPDYSGRRGVLIFEWADEVEDPYTGQKVVKYRPLDDRIFKVLRLADSFRSRDHFEETFEEPERQRELALNKEVREIAAGAQQYWWNIDKVSVGPASRGNWRWRHR